MFRGKSLQVARISLPAFLVIFMLQFLILPGCGNGKRDQVSQAPTELRGQEREVPLKTLAQGVSSTYGRFDEVPASDDLPPECLVITDSEEYERLLSIASFQETPGEVDFTREVVFAALQGPKNTGGYAISIMHAAQTGTEVRLEVEVVEPDPGSMTVQVQTSPYHLVTAERANFEPRGELLFVFVDLNDNRISQESAEI